MAVSSLSCDSTGEAVDLQPSVTTARILTRQSLRSAALCQNGPGLCVDIPATHKWPLVGNRRSVNANAFDSVSIGSSLALTVALSYHTDDTFRLTSSLALTNFTSVLMLDDRAFSEKASMRRAWAEKTSCSPLRATTMMSTSSEAYFTNSSSADGRNPRPEALVMKIVGTSPPNTSIFYLRHTGLPVVAELGRRGSSHGDATVLINRNHSATSRCIQGIKSNSTFSRRRHHSSSGATDGRRHRSHQPFQRL